MTGVVAALGTIGTATATTTAGGAAASSGFLTTLQGVGTAFSALSTMSQARQKAADLKGQAANEELRGREEYTESREEASRLKRAYAETMANQAIAFAASGVDLSSSFVGESKRRVTSDFEREVGFANSRGAAAAASRRNRAVSYRRAAKNVSNTGDIVAFGKIAKFGFGVMRRG